MATSAIGPGFITQTATFTATLGVAFAFGILASILIDFVVQQNIWRGNPDTNECSRGSKPGNTGQWLPVGCVGYLWRTGVQHWQHRGRRFGAECLV